jgi:hypothetical protein
MSMCGRRIRRPCRNDYVRDVGVRGTEIEMEVVTRGLGTRQLQNDGLNQKQMGEILATELTLALATWNPKYSIYERPDGVGEEVAWVVDKTKAGRGMTPG